MNKQREQRMNKFVEHGIDLKDIKEINAGFILFDKYIVAAKVNRYKIKGQKRRGGVDWWPFINIDYFLKKIIRDKEATEKEAKEREEREESEGYCPCCGSYIDY
jgi:uncharacterized DUF497 family protein